MRRGRIWTWMLVFLSGGGIYSVLEILWRGYTHWTMAVTGGVCMVLLGGVNRLCSRWALVFRCLAGSAIITSIELVVGLIVNRAAGLAVWDYSDMPGNLLGQICPTFSAMWFLLCIPAFGIRRGIDWIVAGKGRIREWVAGKQRYPVK